MKFLGITLLLLSALLGFAVAYTTTTTEPWYDTTTTEAWYDTTTAASVTAPPCGGSQGPCGVPPCAGGPCGKKLYFFY